MMPRRRRPEMARRILRTGRRASHHAEPLREAATMPRKLALRPSYHVEVAKPEGVFLLSEREHVVLQGRTYCQLAPFLDGRLTADEIVERLADDVSPAEVYYAIERLGQAGH